MLASMNDNVKLIDHDLPPALLSIAAKAKLAKLSYKSLPKKTNGSRGVTVSVCTVGSRLKNESVELIGFESKNLDQCL